MIKQPLKHKQFGIQTNNGIKEVPPVTVVIGLISFQIKYRGTRWEEDSCKNSKLR